MKIARFDLRSIHNFDFGPKHRVDHLQMVRRRTAKVFVAPQGESILEQLTNRRNRPSDVYGALLKDRVRDELVKHGVFPADAKFTMQWSQKAGCQCGCSPGFVVRGTTTGVDIYVDVEEKQA